MRRLSRAATSLTCTVSIILGAFLSLPAAQAATAVTCPDEPAAITDAQRQRAWDIAGSRLQALSGPATYPFGATGSAGYVRTSAYSWTSGFYPASLWLMYRRTQDRAWLDIARRYTTGVLPVARWNGTHDLGFMVGLPAGLGAELDPSAARRARYSGAMITAARSLATRWNGRVGAVRSGEYGGRWGLIIDSAMNAPLLISAGLAIGGAEGRRLYAHGLRHMLTLDANLVRADGSTFHRMTFDPRTGRRIGPVPGQGLSTTSTWARGQAWAVAGFARAYELTGDVRVLETARRTADYWIARVPAGCVPAWDLDVSAATAPRDSSAAVIATRGLLTLARVEPDTVRAAAYRAYAMTALGTLASQPWLTAGPTGRGVLQRQSYSVPADPREGTYAWGDAYLLEALAESG